MNDRGEKASFTLMYLYKALEREMTVIQQDFRRAGVDMKLQLLDPGAAFQRMLERKFEMGFVNMTSGYLSRSAPIPAYELQELQEQQQFLGLWHRQRSMA